MATFVKRGGVWQARVRRRGHKPLTKTFPRKLLAERWAHKLEEQIAAGTFQDHRSAQRATIEQLCAWYQETVVPTREAGTTETYRLATLTRHLGHYTAAGIGPRDFVAFAKARLKEGVTSDTVRRELDTASDMFTSAVAFEEIALAANPVTLGKALIKKLRIFKPRVKRRRRLLPGEELALMSVKLKSATIQPMIAFALETTMRRTEIVLMRRNDVDVKHRTLRIWHSKTDWKTGKEGRTIPLSPAALEVLKRLPPRVDGTVWGVTDPHSVTRAFARACAAVNAAHKSGDKKMPKIVGLRFHDLRHEAISRLFEKGYTEQQVMVFSGHLDRESVQDYTHLSPALIASRMA